ncbi:MAG: RNA-binding S4 domain-containing protein [Actinomycetaceae bacterium]|nr:RNA-binding S4 domain-containing protein [Actinomycetaceae bacterium]MDY6083048.1 RNA-binding S4 domain-containing protein [Actinomycetaceae bacterium]
MTTHVAHDQSVTIDVDLPIRLGQFVKLASLAPTGGEARAMIEDGMIRVNGKIVEHRSHQLADGDVVTAAGVPMRAIVHGKSS